MPQYLSVMSPFLNKQGSESHCTLPTRSEHTSNACSNASQTQADRTVHVQSQLKWYQLVVESLWRLSQLTQAVEQDIWGILLDVFCRLLAEH